MNLTTRFSLTPPVAIMTSPLCIRSIRLPGVGFSGMDALIDLNCL
jgi:hypothetical protein